MGEMPIVSPPNPQPSRQYHWATLTSEFGPQLVPDPPPGGGAPAEVDDPTPIDFTHAEDLQVGDTIIPPDGRGARIVVAVTPPTGAGSIAVVTAAAQPIELVGYRPGQPVRVLRADLATAVMALHRALGAGVIG